MFWNSLKKKMLIKLMEYYYMKPELQINAQVRKHWTEHDIICLNIRLILKWKLKWHFPPSPTQPQTIGWGDNILHVYSWDIVILFCPNSTSMIVLLNLQRNLSEFLPNVKSTIINEWIQWHDHMIIILFTDKNNELWDTWDVNNKPWEAIIITVIKHRSHS